MTADDPALVTERLAKSVEVTQRRLQVERTGG